MTEQEGYYRPVGKHLRRCTIISMDDFFCVVRPTNSMEEKIVHRSLVFTEDQVSVEKTRKLTKFRVTGEEE